MAEYCAVDEEWLYPIPDGVDDRCAAALALVGITAHLGLFREGQLQSGDPVFVRGGTGGVGSVVIQMAKAAGARVLSSGGSTAKVQRCLELGADAAFNYREKSSLEAVQAFAPQGVRLFWETLREPDFDEIVSCVAERGRIILMAGRDARPAFPVGPFYVKGCSLHGFVMFKATSAEQRACAMDINRWLSEGKLVANIACEFPLSEAAAAHRLAGREHVAQSGHTGWKNPGPALVASSPRAARDDDGRTPAAPSRVAHASVAGSPRFEDRIRCATVATAPRRVCGTHGTDLCQRMR